MSPKIARQSQNTKFWWRHKSERNNRKWLSLPKVLPVEWIFMTCAIMIFQNVSCQAFADSNICLFHSLGCLPYVHTRCTSVVFASADLLWFYDPEQSQSHFPCQKGDRKKVNFIGHRSLALDSPVLVSFKSLQAPQRQSICFMQISHEILALCAQNNKKFFQSEETFLLNFMFVIEIFERGNLNFGVDYLCFQGLVTIMLRFFASRTQIINASRSRQHSFDFSGCASQSWNLFFLLSRRVDIFRNRKKKLREEIWKVRCRCDLLLQSLKEL